jgi:hypothetical protein
MGNKVDAIWHPYRIRFRIAAGLLLLGFPGAVATAITLKLLDISTSRVCSGMQQSGSSAGNVLNVEIALAERALAPHVASYFTIHRHILTARTNNARWFRTFLRQ